LVEAQKAVEKAATTPAAKLKAAKDLAEAQVNLVKADLSQRIAYVKLMAIIGKPYCDRSGSSLFPPPPLLSPPSPATAPPLPPPAPSPPGARGEGNGPGRPLFCWCRRRGTITAAGRRGGWCPRRAAQHGSGPDR